LTSLLPSRSSDQQPSIEELTEAGFLVPELQDESDFPMQLAEKMEASRFIGVLYLMLFDGCNFRCTYCFENGREPRDFRPTMMPPAVAERGLELFASLYRKYPPPPGHEPKVQLYGGEPLLNRDAFIHAVRHFIRMKQSGQMDARVSLATVTNGSCMDRETAEFIASNDVSVGVSIDGPQDLNNAYRKSLAGADAFSVALKALRLLRAAGAKVGVSVTLTPAVVENFPRVMSFLREDIGVDKGLGFNILHYTPGIRLPADYYEKAATCIIDAFREFREMAVWEDRAMRKVMAFVNQEPLHADCAAIGHQIVISPEGTIGICQDYIKSREGFEHSIFEGEFDPFRDRRFLEWSRRSPLHMKQCYDCAALGICGGGCPVSAESVTGSLWDIDTRICPHSKKTLEFLIWDTYGHQAVARPEQSISSA